MHSPNINTSQSSANTSPIQITNTHSAFQSPTPTASLPHTLPAQPWHLPLLGGLPLPNFPQTPLSLLGDSPALTPSTTNNSYVTDTPTSLNIGPILSRCRLFNTPDSYAADDVSSPMQPSEPSSEQSSDPSAEPIEFTSDEPPAKRIRLRQRLADRFNPLEGMESSSSGQRSDEEDISAPGIPSPSSAASRQSTSSRGELSGNAWMLRCVMSLAQSVTEGQLSVAFLMLKDFFYATGEYSNASRNTTEDCQLCQHTPIRHRYQIANTIDSKQSLWIGSKCIRQFAQQGGAIQLTGQERLTGTAASQLVEEMIQKAERESTETDRLIQRFIRR